MKRRCRSLLALPSLFSSSPNSTTTTNDENNVLSQDCALLRSQKERARVFGSSNQNVNNISATSSTSSSQSHSSKTNAKKFFKSLLTSSREKQQQKGNQQQQNDSISSYFLQEQANSSANKQKSCDRIDPPTPQVIHWLLADLFRRGPSTVGVFRKSPNARHCRELKQRLDSVKDLRELDLDSYQVIVVASVFKEWLRSMPDCLLTSRLYPHWIDVARLISLDEERNKVTSSSTNSDSCSSSTPSPPPPPTPPTPSLQSLKIVRQLLARLGDNKLQLLSSFVCVLSRIAQSSDYNKMSPINLGVCVGQSLLVEDFSTATTTLQRASRARSKSRPEKLDSPTALGIGTSQQLLEASSSANSAISCVPLLVAFLIENATILFGEQLDECHRRFTELAAQLQALSSSSPSSAIETPTPSSSRPTTPETSENEQRSQLTKSEHERHHSSLISGTPSPADSGRCTTSGSSSSSSSSSSASDSSFQMMRIEPDSPHNSVPSSTSSTNCDRSSCNQLEPPTTNENSPNHNSDSKDAKEKLKSLANELISERQEEAISTNNNNTQREQPTKLAACDLTDSVGAPIAVSAIAAAAAATTGQLTVKRMAPQPPQNSKNTPTNQFQKKSIQESATTTSVNLTAAQRRLQYKQTGDLRVASNLLINGQSVGCQHQQPQAARRAVSMSASDLAAQAQARQHEHQQALGARNWCLSYYTPWQEPSRSHVMSLRDYYISLQLEHQRQQQQLNLYRDTNNNKLHHHNGYRHLPPIATSYSSHTHLYQHQQHQQQQQQQRHSIHLTNQQIHANFHQNQLNGPQQDQYHHQRVSQQQQQQNQRNLHQHHLLNHHQAPFVSVRPFANSDQFIESTLV